MPASSKAQQRFFGVVKAMQKGDIPKTGKAGKIAKTMSKKDVDDFASTKHKGKPEKVKREMKVRNLIKKMVREELTKMNEVDFSKIKLPSQVDRFLNKFVDSMKGANLNRMKRASILYKVIDAAGMTPQQLMADINKIKQAMKNEGTCGYGENGELGEEPAGPHLIKKKIKESIYAKLGPKVEKFVKQNLGKNKFVTEPSWKVTLTYPKQPGRTHDQWVDSKSAKEAIKISKRMWSGQDIKVTKAVFDDPTWLKIQKAQKTGFTEGKLNEEVEPIGGMAKIAKIVKDKQHAKVGGQTVDMQSANLLMKLYNAVKDKDKEKMNKMSEKKLIMVLGKLWSRVKLKLPT